MSVLHDTVASYDAADKLKVELTNTSEPRRRSFLSVIYAPFRSFAGGRVSLGVARLLVLRRGRLLLGSLLKFALFVAFSLRWYHESWWRVLEFQFCGSSELAVLHMTRGHSAKILLQISLSRTSACLHLVLDFVMERKHRCGTRFPHRSEALVYVGSLYVPIAPIAPLAIAMPFFGPKSRAGRGLRALEEDIRLAQGAAVQDKGGLEPKEKLEDFLLGINWPMMIYISANHLTAVYALVVFIFLGGVCPIFGNGVSMKWQTCVWAGVVYVLSGLGITGGVHRLWSHRSYKAEFPLRVLLMLFNSCANQGTIFHWARDHRVHHLYSDTVADPHNAMNGFFYCHVGWLVTKKHPAVAAAGKGSERLRPPGRSRRNVLR